MWICADKLAERLITCAKSASSFPHIKNNESGNTKTGIPLSFY